LLNAIAVLIMVTSGWQIYNASPIFGFEFPSALTLGGWLAGALLWHFAAMWLLVVNGLFYVTRSLVTSVPSCFRCGEGTIQRFRGAARQAGP
jgi:thiosulfate reductase cytochrome b subunit